MNSDAFLKNGNSAELQPEHHETQWLAMQYVLGDLTDEQTEQFELAMVEDVTLCESVLMATRLSAGIVQAYDSQLPFQSATRSVPKAESPPRPRFVRFSVFAATAALTMVVILLVTFGGSAQPILTAAHDDATADDATADALAMLLNNAPANEISSEFDELIEADDSISSLVAPAWLLTAVDLDEAAREGDHKSSGPEKESGVY
ncbi:MAG: hypothetical protein R3C17_09415 [Planctomycetaceae bacterium]